MAEKPAFDMSRIVQLSSAVLLVAGVISLMVQGYCFDRLQISPREPRAPFVYELTHRFQARYVDQFHYQLCPASEIASAVGIIGPILIVGVFALLAPELFRASRLGRIQGLPLARMKSIDIRGYGIVVVFFAGLVTTILVLARSSN